MNPFDLFIRRHKVNPVHCTPKLQVEVERKAREDAVNKCQRQTGKSQLGLVSVIEPNQLYLYCCSFTFKLCSAKQRVKIQNE